jgi:hypothetical protein
MTWRRWVRPARIVTGVGSRNGACSIRSGPAPQDIYPAIPLKNDAVFANDTRRNPRKRRCRRIITAKLDAVSKAPNAVLISPRHNPPRHFPIYYANDQGIVPHHLASLICPGGGACSSSGCTRACARKTKTSRPSQFQRVSSTQRAYISIRCRRAQNR